MVQKATTLPEISIGLSFFPQIWHVHVFWGEETGGGVRIPKF